jgi:hypothetical protein
MQNRRREDLCNPSLLAAHNIRGAGIEGIADGPREKEYFGNSDLPRDRRATDGIGMSWNFPGDTETFANRLLHNICIRVLLVSPVSETLISPES